MRVFQPRPEFIKPHPLRADIVKIPWVETPGSPNSPYEYNNYAHAALSSILSALKSGDKESVHIWLKTAKIQICGALRAINKSYAKVPPPSRSAKK